MTRPDPKEERLFDAPVLVRTGPRELLFYRAPEGELAWREKSAAGWSEARPLPRQGRFFCAAVGQDLRPHLVVLEAGALFYLPFPEMETDAVQPFYRDPEKDCLHPLLTVDRQANLHLLYLALDRTAGRWWFLHHRCAQEHWAEPRVVDFGGGLQPLHGTVAVDRRNILHFAYLLAEGEQFRLYYRCYDPDGAWSKAVPVNGPGQVSRPVLLPGPDFNLHLLWVAGYPHGYRVVYREWIREGWGGRWKDEVHLSPPYPEPPSPFLILKPGGPAAGWLAGDTVYHCARKAGGWSSVEVLEPIAGKPLSVLRPAFIRSGENIAGWIPASGDPPCPVGQYQESSSCAAAPFGALTTDEIDSYFRDLDQYSQGLISRASSLSTAKSQLEQALEGKQRELVWLSRQSERRLENLNRNMQEKDRKLKELQEHLQETIRNLRTQTEQSRRAWEEKQQQGGALLKKLQQDSLHLKRMLMEKEQTIRNLETQLHKQALQLTARERENHALNEKLAQKQPFYRKMLAFFHQISQGGKTS